MSDPYSVLGVKPDASDDAIKRAYRELARKYHPDNYQNNPLADLAEEKMKEINQAYDTITKMRSVSTPIPPPVPCTARSASASTWAISAGRSNCCAPRPVRMRSGIFSPAPSPTGRAGWTRRPNTFRWPAIWTRPTRSTVRPW